MWGFVEAMPYKSQYWPWCALDQRTITVRKAGQIMSRHDISVCKRLTVCKVVCEGMGSLVVAMGTYCVLKGFLGCWQVVPQIRGRLLTLIMAEPCRWMLQCHWYWHCSIHTCRVGININRVASWRPRVLIRKSKDYVYGIWVHKALGIWKGY